MKNSQNGFVSPILLGIIALLVIGGGVYVYKNKKEKASEANVETQQSNKNQQQTNTQTSPVATQKNNNSVVPAPIKTPDIKSVPQNFSTYNNSGLKLNYPKNWTIIEDPSRSDDTLIEFSIETPKTDTSRYGKLFFQFAKKGELPLSTMMKVEQNTLEKSGATITEPMPFEFAGMSGNRFTATLVDNTGTKYESLIFVNGRLIVSFAGRIKGDSTYDDTVMNIINSIKIQ